MGLELILEEPNFRDLRRIESDYDSIAFMNSVGMEVDSSELVDFMSKLEGRGKIEKLSISFNSQLKDLQVVRAFPNLRYIAVYGYRIDSLDGLEWFQRGESIKISTESKNRRRKIAQISRAPIKQMSLQVAQPEDLDAVGECLTLNELELFRSSDLEFSKWSRVPLESLRLKQGKFIELGNTADVRSLKWLWVLGCRSLERFTGDNSKIIRLLIDDCKKLDLRTVQTFQGLETLIVNSIPNEIGLTEMGTFKQLESLSLIHSKVQVDTTELKRHFPKLKELHISNLKNGQVLELSQLNPGVLVSGRIFFRKDRFITYKALNGKVIEE
ncbi:hypothetical protein PAE9249_03749 [Paenibacillus sp. CECT 9249]|uniref:hypothetical protein n=1 Tax=Paenibacillus sp. CECT 9249 TaxID=2845385 RepID=UPI001E5C3828|nr:hypothetical protein [Paenibacillus sp. CECT 9249]CAH0121223.1 hypothetical protein PAE9249_03749 [Paenibacillus sp. CECT 9249]